jgi:hypothetical protein
VIYGDDNYSDAAGDASCTGKAYLVPNDKVIVGETCDGWADVQFEAGGKKSWGWVESDKLRRQKAANHDPLLQALPDTGGVVVQCEPAQQRMTILRLGILEGHISVPGEPSLETQQEAAKRGTILKDHGDTADCRWANGTQWRVRYGEGEGSATAMGGGCPATFLSLWHDRAQWLQGVKVGGFYGAFSGRATDRVVLTPKGMQHCTVPPGDDCWDANAQDGPDREVCEFSQSTQLPVAIDRLEYPPSGKPRLPTNSLALLQSRNDALCKAIVDSGSISLLENSGQPRTAEAGLPKGIVLIGEATRPPHPKDSDVAYKIDPQSHRGTYSWLYFDFDNSGRPSWVASRTEDNNFHSGDEYY